jgi:hypothetical protein
MMKWPSMMLWLRSFKELFESDFRRLPAMGLINRRGRLAHRETRFPSQARLASAKPATALTDRFLQAHIGIPQSPFGCLRELHSTWNIGPAYGAIGTKS